MTFEPAPTTDASFWLQPTSDAKLLFCVECPSGREALPAATAPFTRSPDHALLRPFEKLLFLGDPNCGTIQYTLIKSPGTGEPRVLHATSILQSRGAPSGQTVPGTLCIFPGFGPGRFTDTRGEHFGIHHVTVRETTGGKLEVYARPPRYQQGQVVREPPAVGHMALGQNFDAVHLSTFYISAPNHLPLGGLAICEVNSHVAGHIRRLGRLGNQPIADRHFYDYLNYPKDFPRPHHLQVTYALSQKPLAEEALPLVARVSVGRAPHPDWNEDILARANNVDLSPAFPGAGYRWLTSIASVVPGAVGGEVAVRFKPFGVNLP